MNRLNGNESDSDSSSEQHRTRKSKKKHHSARGGKHSKGSWESRKPPRHTAQSRPNLSWTQCPLCLQPRPDDTSADFCLNCGSQVHGDDAMPMFESCDLLSCWSCLSPPLRSTARAGASAEAQFRHRHRHLRLHQARTTSCLMKTRDTSTLETACSASKRATNGNYSSSLAVGYVS